MKKPIRLPNEWAPRPYQRKLWGYHEKGGRYSVAIWHRRAGKDEVALNLAATAAVERVGVYWHMLPEAAQARKAIWAAVDPHTGRNRIEKTFPKELIARKSNQEMSLTLINGSVWQVVGSDNYNSLIGSPPVGITFSEYSVSNPAAWAILRPILAENNGWAMFIYTPRGKNHGFDLYQSAQKSDRWFSQILTVDDTDVFTQETLKEELFDLKREYGLDQGQAYFNQEYYCSFEAAILGAVYGEQMQELSRNKQICSVPHQRSESVITAWDLGFNDATAIWFMQVSGREIHVIDYLENNGKAVDYYVEELNKRKYNYSQHLLPHDAANHEKHGKTYKQMLEHLGVKNCFVVPKYGLNEGINATRMALPNFWFDEEKTELGVEALRQYHYKYDEKEKTMSRVPNHTWASHGADALRTFVMGYAGPSKMRRPIPRKRVASSYCT